MRESIGGAQVLLISVTILLVIIILLSASIGYTKAFKVRNAIVNIVQKYGAYGKDPSNIFDDDPESSVNKELEQIVTDMGYMVNVGINRECEDRGQNARDDESLPYKVVAYHHPYYNFCIYQYTDNETGDQHYGVQTYMYFELPIFGRNDRFSFPLYADTYTFFKTGLSD